MKKKPHLRLQLKKRWTPKKGFKDLVFTNEGVWDFKEVLQHESWAEWSLRPNTLFQVIPPMPPQRYRPTAMRAFISAIDPRKI